MLCLYRGQGEHPLAAAARAAGIGAATIADPGALRPGVLGRVRERLAKLGPALVHTYDYRSDWCGYFCRAQGAEAVWLAESHGHTAETRRMALWNACDRWLLRRADAVAAVSTAWETALVAAGVSAARLHVIGNSSAVLPMAPMPAPVSLPEGRHLLYAGRLAPEKGLDLLLDIWKVMLAAYRDLHLWIVGAPAASASYRRRLAPLLAQSGVHAMGFQEDVRPWYQVVDAVVAPSRREAWGMTIFEALAAGTPTVAARTGGVPDLCRGAGHAVLVTPDSGTALVEGIERVLDGSMKRDPALGDAYRSQARFEPSLRCQRFLDLYRSQVWA